MHAWYLICFLSALAVFIAFTNQYILKLQTTIAITTGAVVISLLLIFVVGFADNDLANEISNTVASLNFNQLLLQGMLGFLLFAGALEIDLQALKKQRWEITILVLFSTLTSTFMVGGLTYYGLALVGWSVPFIYCLLFGALISPTDPIAVLAIIKQMNAPEGISVQVEGESLFNDGVGLVVFSTIFSVAFMGTAPTFSGVASLFLTDAVGGVLFGFLLAQVAHWLMRKSRGPGIRLLITMLIPTSGFALANILEVSGALAMVVSGIFIGNITMRHVTSSQREETERNLQAFWHATDAFLNGLLFLLIGLLLVTFPISITQVLLGFMAVPLVLLARWVSVSIPYIGFRRFREYDVNSVRILTWGGLRGGLALAMAASIPSNLEFVNGVDIHRLILIMTYIVVIFSIIVQGGTISPLLRKSVDAAEKRAKAASSSGQQPQ
ncbi:sodium:proton antiporter [Terasakiispira papahanaumokuakeensis]|uniref:Sodium:proton antiporter n=1 Tax=Terasakiispira papahanaumokuakeensis TaxID=197479 RepID=A0A1E2V7U9_9GAMM|nr:sodium:proton antiporter [Terasakiispira papahanaumokuakeensis]ODC02916.1 sodium:proton antiporter [Terasakiispira papahanaumokuakeensis]